MHLVVSSVWKADILRSKFQFQLAELLHMKHDGTLLPKLSKAVKTNSLPEENHH